MNILLVGSLALFLLGLGMTCVGPVLVRVGRRMQGKS